MKHPLIQDYFEILKQHLGKWRGLLGDDDKSLDVAYLGNKNKNIAMIHDAGWHFSSILDDAGILKKKSGAADYFPTDEVPDYREFRSTSLHPVGYFGVTWPENNVLPKEVWMKDKYKQFLIEYNDDYYKYLAKKNDKTRPWEQGWNENIPEDHTSLIPAVYAEYEFDDHTEMF